MQPCGIDRAFDHTLHEVLTPTNVATNAKPVVTRRRDTRQDNVKSEHASGNPPSPTRVMVTPRA
jgi:hypothetical protein